MGFSNNTVVRAIEAIVSLTGKRIRRLLPILALIALHKVKHMQARAAIMMLNSGKCNFISSYTESNKHSCQDLIYNKAILSRYILTI